MEIEDTFPGNLPPASDDSGTPGLVHPDECPLCGELGYTVFERAGEPWRACLHCESVYHRNGSATGTLAADYAGPLRHGRSLGTLAEAPDTDVTQIDGYDVIPDRAGVYLYNQKASEKI